MTPVTGDKARPLPRRTKLQSGDTIAVFIERLAAANHLPEPYVRGYLRPPGSYNNAVTLEHLAALSGYDPGVLTRVFTAPRCLHCTNMLPTRAKKTSSPWCSAHCRQAAAALRQNPRAWATGIESIDPGGQAACPLCGQQIMRSRTGRPPRWCSATCRKAAYDVRYRDERTRHRHRDWQLVTTRTPPTL
jgi:hypothetical protein